MGSIPSNSSLISLTKKESNFLEELSPVPASTFPSNIKTIMRTNSTNFFLPNLLLPPEPQQNENEQVKSDCEKN